MTDTQKRAVLFTHELMQILAPAGTYITVQQWKEVAAHVAKLLEEEEKKRG